jgi:hypothetical protein
MASETSRCGREALQCAAHGRVRCATGRRGTARTAVATVGAVAAARAAIPAGDRSGCADARARRGVSEHLAVPRQQGRAHACKGRGRRSDADPALRLGTEPERALPFAVPRWLLPRYPSHAIVDDWAICVSTTRH